MSALGLLRQTSTATRMFLVESSRELGLLLGFTIVFPIGILFFLDVLVVPGLRVQVLVGTIMMETALLNVNALAQTIGGDKQTKIFDLWVSLPVNPIVYTLSVAVGFLPYTLASAVATIAVGAAVFGITVPASALPLLFVGFVLAWASTVGIGFLIGVYGRTSRQISAIAQMVGIILTFFTPVFYPLSVLPPPLRLVAEAWPLTWASGFLVAAVGGAQGTLLLSGAVLLGFVAVWFTLVGLGLRWRQT